MATQYTPGDGAVPPAVTPPQSEGTALVHQGESLSPTPPAVPLTDWAPILDALTAQQHRYLAALQAGASLQEALLRAGGPASKGVSGSSLTAWLRNPHFARAHAAVHAGLAVLGVPAARALAAADMPDLVGHWSRKAREAAKDRDQATFGRLISDVSGATGQGAQVQVSIQSSWRLPPTPLTHQPGGIIEGEWREPDAATEPEPASREAADAQRTDDEHR